MDDRKLLELAAKAAGIEIEWDSPFVAIGDFGQVPYNKATGDHYDPLTDDGDALRLAVALHLDINCYPKSKEVAAVQHRQNTGAYARSIERIADDPYAATRRAIVRAAASLATD